MISDSPALNVVSLILRLFIQTLPLTYLYFIYYFVGKQLKDRVVDRSERQHVFEYQSPEEYDMPPHKKRTYRAYTHIMTQSGVFILFVAQNI